MNSFRKKNLLKKKSSEFFRRNLDMVADTFDSIPWEVLTAGPWGFLADQSNLRVPGMRNETWG